MKTKTKARLTLAGILSAILLTIGSLATLGIMSLGKGCEGGKFGVGLNGSNGGLSSGTQKSTGDGKWSLVITLEGEQYLVDGTPRSFDETVAAAVEASRNQTSQSEPQILLKKKNARYMTVQKLEDELKRRGIRYRSENDF